MNKRIVIVTYEIPDYAYNQGEWYGKWLSEMQNTKHVTSIEIKPIKEESR